MTICGSATSAKVSRLSFAIGCRCGRNFTVPKAIFRGALYIKGNEIRKGMVKKFTMPIFCYFRFLPFQKGDFLEVGHLKIAICHKGISSNYLYDNLRFLTIRLGRCGRNFTVIK